MTKTTRYVLTALVVVALLAGCAMAGAFAGLFPLRRVVQANPAEASVSDPTSSATTPRIITVQGEATIKVKPDTAEVRLGMQTQEKTALAAQQANNQLMNQVIDALKKAGVKEDDLTTTQFSIQAVYDYNNHEPGSPPTLVGYQVSNILKVKTKNMDNVGSLIDVATRAGANRVDGINFFVEDTSALERDGLKDAVKDAREKAELLAAAAGTTIKDVLTITEQGASVPQPPVYYNAAAREAADSSTPIYSGEQTLTVRVTVQFLHE